MTKRFALHDEVVWGNVTGEVRYTVETGRKYHFAFVTEDGRYWAGRDSGDGNWELFDEEGQGHADINGAMAEARAAF